MLKSARIIASILVLLGFSLSPSFSENITAWQPGMIEIVDVPTAEVVDHYGYHVSFRFFKGGGIQNKTTFGIFPRLNIGFGMDAERVIGTDDSRLNDPTINVKFRLFNGKRALPALALGYDAQGHNFNRQLDEYEQREKGLYLVASKEMIAPGFVLTGGVNHFTFKEGNATRGFVGMTYTYEQTIGLMFEWDHVSDYDERRINFGGRYFVTPVFTIDVIGRNVPTGFRMDDRETERVVRLGYTGSF